VYCVSSSCRLVTASNAVASSASVFTSLLARDILTTRCCYSTTYNKGGSSAAGDCLTRASDSTENTFSCRCDIAVTQPPGRTAKKTPRQFFYCSASNCCYAHLAFTVPSPSNVPRLSANVAISSTYLYLGLPSGLSPSGFTKKILYETFNHTRATCSMKFLIV
jgi:hypothetical protein